MMKTKSIASCPVLPPYIVSKVNTSNYTTTPAYANVTARLYNSNPVKNAVVEALGMVKERLGIEKARPESRKRKRGADFLREEMPTEPMKHLDSSMNNASRHSYRAGSESDDEGQVQIPRDNLQDFSAGSEFEDFEQYSQMLASSSGTDDSSNRDKDMDDAARPSKATGGMRDSSFSPTPMRPPQQSNPKASNSKSPTTSAKSMALLPSLTLSGYLSNSESTASESDPAVANIKIRKNRMGQQARRQLWEKKFGHKANHIKTQSRDQGWNEKKGAQSRDERNRRGRRRDTNGIGKRHQGSQPRPQGLSGANNDPIGPRRERKKDGVKAEGPLHPSWEAAKRRKEVKKSVAFEGKKIVFD